MGWVTRIINRLWDRRRSHYFGARPYDESNVNDDHARRGREDYSVLLLAPGGVPSAPNGQAPAGEPWVTRRASETASGGVGWTTRRTAGGETSLTSWVQRRTATTVTEMVTYRFRAGGTTPTAATTWVSRRVGTQTTE